VKFSCQLRVVVVRIPRLRCPLTDLRRWQAQGPQASLGMEKDIMNLPADQEAVLVKTGRSDTFRKGRLVLVPNETAKAGDDCLDPQDVPWSTLDVCHKGLDEGIALIICRT
jgi:hypothetical protein